MLLSGILCMGCYLLTTLAALPALGMAGCALCGFFVGIMWPGTLSISSQICPAGGTAMFAFLALAGDFGGTVGPMMVGVVSDLADGNLKKGLLAAVVFPAALALGLAALQNKKEESFPKSLY